MLQLGGSGSQARLQTGLVSSVLTAVVPIGSLHRLQQLCKQLQQRWMQKKEKSGVVCTAVGREAVGGRLSAVVCLGCACLVWFVQ